MAKREQIGCVACAFWIAIGCDPDEVVQTRSEIVEMERGLGFRLDVQGSAWTSYAGEAW